MGYLAWILAAAMLLSGCAPAALPPETQPATQAATIPVTQPPETTLPETLPPQTIPIAAEAALLSPPPAPAVPLVLECQAPGLLEERAGDTVVDYSNTADGYVMVRHEAPSEVRMKVRITGPTTTYTYNLPPEDWTVYPLSDGDGNYQITVYRNVSGSKYATVMAANFEAALRDEFAPFLRPNQYVNYADAPNTMAQGEQLCTGLETPLQKVEAVYDYVVDNLVYDDHKASTVQSGYLPALDGVLEEKKGICFDYAALMTAMLRSQQVPCKLVVGYAGSAYHAWISVWTEEDGWVDGAIFFDGQSWKRMDPTFASSSQRSEEIQDFIENGKYTQKYLY